MRPLTREQSRSIDRIAIEQYGMSGLVLMENAGRNAAEKIAAIAPPGPILILCGQGNNAGDGYVIARHLELMGRQPEILSVVAGEKLSGDAAVNAAIAERAGITIGTVTKADALRASPPAAPTIVDCLLGTGARGELREPYRTAVELANEANALRIAIDVPTGLDVDTGSTVGSAFRARHTITFVSSKVGFTQSSAVPYVGELHVVGIGVPLKLLSQTF